MTTDSKMLAANAGLRAALGHYGLVAEIGRGGMSSAFLALLPKGDGTRRQVVLKQLRSEFCLQDGFRAMFENEAFLGARFRHENVVETYDSYSDRDLSVLIMEFLDGQTLAGVRERAKAKRIPVPFAIHLRVLADALAGLHYVHELKDDGQPLGIVHRNVTPSNVFVTYDGGVKVIDFAIAKTTLRDAEARMSGVVKGHIGYMSPEAVRRESVDRRTDIFSIGVMLWEAATGRRLWEGHDEIAVFRRLAAGDLPLQTLHPEGTSAEMLRIAARALAPDPSHRYATAEDMRRELENALARLGNATPVATLTAYMETFFSVERAKSRTVVDEALATLASTPPVAKGQGLGTDAHAPCQGGDSTEPPPRRTSPLASTGTFATTSTSYDIRRARSDVPSLRRRVRRIIGVASMPAAAAIGIAYAAHAPSGAPPRTAGAPIADEPAATHADMASKNIASPPASPPARPVPLTTSDPAATAPAALSAHGTISAVFLVRPAHARLFLDGAPLEGNPAGIRRQPDNRPHLLRVEAPGYATLVRAIDLDRDLATELELAPEPATERAAPRAAPSSEPRDELPKSYPAKRTLVRDDPWGI